jgi:putative inorganic carbon (HCO3(-)) transporter
MRFAAKTTRSRIRLKSVSQEVGQAKGLPSRGDGILLADPLDQLTAEKSTTAWSLRLPKTAEEIALWCAFGSGVAVVFSIAISQILLGGALAALFLGRLPLRFPRITLPLALFLVGTLIAFAFSEVRSAGLSQIKHMYLYLTLPVIFTTLRTPSRAAKYYMAVAAATALMAVLGCVQFARKVHEAHALGKTFYEYYLEARITGLQKHWMAFSGQELYGLLIAAAWLFFAPLPKVHAKLRIGVGIFCAGSIGLALLLGETRSVWAAAFFGVIYLLWFWRRILAWCAPLVVVIGLLLAPASIQQRVVSMVHPHGDTDSNSHRVVCWLTGWQMIKAHPLLGLGPDVQKLKFYDYVPPEIPWPLPAGFYGHLHSIYIQYAADRGIPTMLMLVWFLLKIIGDAWRKLKSLPPGRSESRFILHAAIACTAGSMISGIFEYNLNTSVILALFLAIAAGAAIVVEDKAGLPAK